MKWILPIIIGVSILTCSTTSGVAQVTPLQVVVISVEQEGRRPQIDHECQYPLNPSSILSVLLFFQEGIKYITPGDKRCPWYFVKELEAAVRNLIFMPSYFQEKFLENIRKAKKRFDTI